MPDLTVIPISESDPKLNSESRDLELLCNYRSCRLSPLAIHRFSGLWSLWGSEISVVRPYVYAQLPIHEKFAQTPRLDVY